MGSKMSKRFRRWTILFACVQLTGLVSICIWHLAKAPGLFFWDAAFITLLPGNLLAERLIERLLWNTGLSLRAMSIIEIPLLVAFNAMAWFVVIGSIRWLLGRRFR
jgi:uncharacterized membrane protein YjjB (DUF3815 family)